VGLQVTKSCCSNLNGVTLLYGAVCQMFNINIFLPNLILIHKNRLERTDLRGDFKIRFIYFVVFRVVRACIIVNRTQKFQKNILLSRTEIPKFDVCATVHQIAFRTITTVINTSLPQETKILQDVCLKFCYVQC